MLRLVFLARMATDCHTIPYQTIPYHTMSYLVENTEAGVPGEDGHGLPVRDAQEREPVDLVQLVTELHHTSGNFRKVSLTALMLGCS